MKESYESGSATHIGPESCGAAREGGVEALTGECAGRALSRVSRLYAYLREEEEQWTVHGVAADDSEKDADEAE
jgi:hypothetical protein